jgi:hypothetical protein
MSAGSRTPSETLAELNSLWKASIQEVPTPPSQAVVGGFNLRFNLAKALTAVGATASACVAAAGVATMNPVALVGLPVSLFSAVAAAIAAVYEKMHPLHYVACIELAKYPQGLTKEELKDRLTDFLASADHTKFPWYLGLTKERLSTAAQAFQAENSIDNLVTGLKQKRYADENDGRIIYTVPNFQLGLFPD